MTLSSVDHPLDEQDVYMFPVSFAQQRLWLIDQLDGQSTAYNLFYLVRVITPLDLGALEQSLQEIIQRHEPLRTIFVVHEGQPMQMILPKLKVPMQVIDLEYLPREHRETEVQKLASIEAQKPFDLATGPLLGITVFRLGAEEHFLLLTIHHIIFDGWSEQVFFSELATFYQSFTSDQTPLLPELPIQYVDFTIWQREQLQGEVLKDQLSYWKKTLADAPTTLELPTDRPRPTTPTFRGSIYRFKLPQSLADSLKALSRKEGVSLFTTLVASFQTLLYRYTGQDELLLGMDTANRSEAGTDNLIGFFVNTLVLRAELTGNPTFSELLGRTQRALLGAYGHQDIPVEYLVKELQPDRSPGKNPFFQVMFSFLEMATPHLPPGWEMSPLEIKTGAAKFDLSIEMQEQRDGFLTYLEYNTDLFDEVTIIRMVEHWQKLLEGIAVNPNQHIDDLPLLSEFEWQKQVIDWNATWADYPQNQCFQRLFEEQVERTPEALAVTDEQTQFTYQQLNQRANYLAHYLQERGVGPETVVALLAERSSAFLTAILAIFKAGGAYLPLDPHHPSHRLRQVLEQSGTRLIVVSNKLLPVLTQTFSEMQAEPQVIHLDELLVHPDSVDSNVHAASTPHNLAYVIYTSGSTGLPKGVMIEQRGMINHLFAKISTLQLSATDRVAQTASQCFDISVWQFLAALLVGGSIHILSDEVAHHPRELLKQVEQQQISILETVPSLLRAVLEAIESGRSDAPRLERLRWLVPTGEALPPALCERWLTAYPRIPLLNAYGPTECSDDVTHYPIYQPLPDTLMHTPIGRPISNMKMYILDRKLRPLPMGVSGELYVGGIGVGRGYLNDPLRTAEAFVADPFSSEPGARLYKTGDLAHYLPDGNIVFLGRIDHQVKIRGNRIELGEIEAVLHQHSAVQDVVVLAREDAPGDKYLVSYVVASTNITANDLRNYLKEKLPDYMLPSAFMLLNALPLTSNGKVDRRALPMPERTETEFEGTYVAPVLPVHKQLIEIWEELLDVRPIGIRDDFFDIGGHSLLAIRLLDRIEQVFGKKISAATLLANSTIEELAALLIEFDGTQAAAEGQAGNAKQPSSGRNPLISSIKTLWARSRSSSRTYASSRDSSKK